MQQKERKMLMIIQIVTALLALGLAAVRLIESINELSKKPELSTAQKCWQVVKNFFTIEKYAVK
jgi:hypothetical protein